MKELSDAMWLVEQLNCSTEEDEINIQKILKNLSYVATAIDNQNEERLLLWNKIKKAISALETNPVTGHQSAYAVLTAKIGTE